MEKKPTLTLMVGLPGAGKTTRAKELEQATGAVRFTPDEWHLFLFGDDFHDPREHALHDQRHDRVEELQWRLGKRLLAQGVSVILAFGPKSSGRRNTGRPRPWGQSFPSAMSTPPWRSCAAAWRRGCRRARRTCFRPSLGRTWSSGPPCSRSRMRRRWTATTRNKRLFEKFGKIHCFFRWFLL